MDHLILYSNLKCKYYISRHLRKRYKFFAGVGNRQQLIWQQVRYFHEKGTKKYFLELIFCILNLLELKVLFSGYVYFNQSNRGV